jgi:hypothetical protein
VEVPRLATCGSSAMAGGPRFMKRAKSAPWVRKFWISQTERPRLVPFHGPSVGHGIIRASSISANACSARFCGDSTESCLACFCGDPTYSSLARLLPVRALRHVSAATRHIRATPEADGNAALLEIGKNVPFPCEPEEIICGKSLIGTAFSFRWAGPPGSFSRRRHIGSILRGRRMHLEGERGA